MLTENKLKIFITGSSGFIGRNLLYKLESTPHIIYCYKRGQSLDYIQEFQPDIIYHIAGETKDESKMYETNIQLTYDLLEASKNINYKAFINIGSSSEYGRKQQPFKETDVCIPTNIYEATKVSGTLLCQAFGKKFHKPILTVRVFTIYGKYEQEYKLIPTIYNNIQQNIKTRIVSDAVHDFTYIEDLINFLYDVPQKSDIISGDIVNFGTGIQTSNLEVIRVFEKVLNTHINYEIVNDINIFKPYDTTTWVCDTTYLKYKYNFITNYTLEEGIRRYVLFKESQKKNN